MEEYLAIAPQQLNFVYIPQLSQPGDSMYQMLPEYGEGTLRKIDWKGLFFVLIADFTPQDNFLRVSEIGQEYLEISQFETDSSSFTVGGRKLHHVNKGICCYINTSKIVHAYCEAQTPTRFTKIIITKDYYDDFLKGRYGQDYSTPAEAIRLLAQTPDLPKVNLIFQQIRECQARGISQQIYFESKVLELLSLVTHHLEQQHHRKGFSVKLDTMDLRALGKVISFIKKDLSAYPSIVTLAKVAHMSTTRFQMAFKQTYGVTIYDYFREIRMNHGLLLLKDSDYSIKEIAATVGYNNAGHFAGMFKKTYGMSPKKYRNLYQIK